MISQMMSCCQQRVWHIELWVFLCNQFSYLARVNVKMGLTYAMYLHYFSKPNYLIYWILSFCTKVMYSRTNDYVQRDISVQKIWHICMLYNITESNMLYIWAWMHSKLFWILKTSFQFHVLWMFSVAGTGIIFNLE